MPLELLPSCHKLLFFAHHKPMLNEVESRAVQDHGRSVAIFRIDGSTPTVERQRLVSEFQKLPPERLALFLLSIQAAGQGLTLTNASTAVFGELRWVPGELLQAEDRCHRIGQARSRHCDNFVVTSGELTL